MFRQPRSKMTLISTSFLTTGLVAGILTALPGAPARAEDAPIRIPMRYVYEESRLGIFVGVNGGVAKTYMFDTGSDDFNGQLYPATATVPAGEQTFSGYGDGTYGYIRQPVQINALTFYDANGKAVTSVNRDLTINQILHHVYTEDYQPLDGTTADLSRPIELNGVTYYIDPAIQTKLDKGEAAETDGTFGTFGSGNFGNSLLGNMTKTGFIVAANGNITDSATPGCAPCTIVNLNPSLRAQFDNFIPWSGTDDLFPVSGANRSQMYSGAFTLIFEFEVNGETKTREIKGPIMFDTGVSQEIMFQNGNAIKELQADGLELKPNSDTRIISLAIRGTDGKTHLMQTPTITRLNNEPNDDGIILGLPFFKWRSVINDLEQMATGFTPYFVSADNFSTEPHAGMTTLSHITATMGNQGSLGLAGVISGAGSLTLDSGSDVRMTNVNSYSGATNISAGAWLSLAGPGSIEQSHRVRVDGTFDISKHGNFNPLWGLDASDNNVRIRSLAGAQSGVVWLGNRQLIITAGHDDFAGFLQDQDEDNESQGGGLQIAGGVQRLSGEALYSGLTGIDQGAALMLSGSIRGDVETAGLLGNDGVIEGRTDVLAHGIAAGSGTYQALTIGAGGSVDPGSLTNASAAIATMVVKGDLIQNAGSTYRLKIAGNQDSSDIAVEGTASIDPDSSIELIRHLVSPQTRARDLAEKYTILTAAAGVEGHYGELTGQLATDAPFLSFDLSYDANAVYLEQFRSTVAFADVATSANQRNVAMAAEQLDNAVYASLAYLSHAEARAAFDALSGEAYASSTGALANASGATRSSINSRLQQAFGGTPASPVSVLAFGPDKQTTPSAAAIDQVAPAAIGQQDLARYAAWGSVFGSWSAQSGDGNAARTKSTLGGFTSGLDAAVYDNWRLGLMAGYSHSTFKTSDRGSSGSSDNYTIGGYAGTEWGNLGFRSGLAYSWHNIEMSRSVVFNGFSDSLSADYNGGTFQAFGELGYKIKASERAIFEPYANLAYVHVKTDAFSESGQNGAALAVQSNNMDLGLSTLGIRASTNFDLGQTVATARADLGWRHAFGDVIPTSTASFVAGSSAFTTAGNAIGKDTALIEAGLDFALAKNTTLGVAYQGQFGSGFSQNGVNANLSVKF